MASVSVSHLILFIASIVIAASVAGVFTTSVDDLAGALDDQGLQVSENVRTSVQVISDSGSNNVYDDDEETLTLLVKNVGTTALDADESQLDVLVNGEFVTSDELSVAALDSTDEHTWARGEVVEVTVDRELAPGDHRATVIVGGDEERFEFRVEP